MNKKILLSIVAITLATSASYAQQGDPRATEYYSPVPKVVTPGQTCDNAPSDAIVLFDGTSLNEWEAVKNPASGNNWKLVDHIMTVDKTVGDIQTKKTFTDFQLHIEYRIPENITGTGQARGNSGVFLASIPFGAGGYELQVLDNYNNSTYVNGQAGSPYNIIALPFSGFQ